MNRSITLFPVLVIGILLTGHSNATEEQSDARDIEPIDAEDIIGAPEIGIRMYQNAIRRGWHLSPAGSIPRKYPEPVASFVEGKYQLSYPAFHGENSTELRALVDEPGFKVHAKTIQDAIGLRFSLASEIPIDVISDDLSEAGFAGDSPLGIAQILNVRLESPSHEVSLPQTGNLRVRISGHHELDAVVVDVPMVSNGQEARFFMSNPIESFRKIDSARQSFLDEEKSIPRKERKAGLLYPRKPVLELEALTGFEFDEDTIEDMPGYGVLLIHHIYLGSFRLTTGYQWGGGGRSPLRFARLATSRIRPLKQTPRDIENAEAKSLVSHPEP